MLPTTKIVIGKDGNSRIEGMEQTDSCFKLSELGKLAGKVESDEKKDHAPVYNTVIQKN